jgi:D-mannonate dehydratase
MPHAQAAIVKASAIKMVRMQISNVCPVAAGRGVRLHWHPTQGCRWSQ